MLSTSEKQYLLHAARKAIESAVTASPFMMDEPPASLKQLSGAFVTLHQHGELRGCIGYIDRTKPLIETVTTCAVKAAFDDPRFFPVTSSELATLEIEISVLSPLRRIERLEEIEVGVHGLVVESEDHRGLLLPQVAVEHRWDRETFFRHTLQKAGIYKGDRLIVFVFTAEIFNEESIVETGT